MRTILYEGPSLKVVIYGEITEAEKEIFSYEVGIVIRAKKGYERIKGGPLQ